MIALALLEKWMENLQILYAMSGHKHKNTAMMSIMFNMFTILAPEKIYPSKKT